MTLSWFLLNLYEIRVDEGLRWTSRSIFRGSTQRLASNISYYLDWKIEEPLFRSTRENKTFYWGRLPKSVFISFMH